MRRITHSALPFLMSALMAVLLVGCGAATGPTSAPTPTSQLSSSPTSSAPGPTPTSQSGSSPTPSASPLPGPPSATPQPTTGGSSHPWEAYASGLASHFTKGDIASLEQPFVLEGDALPVSSGLVANFTPTGPTTGDYTFTNNIVAGGCVDSSSGTYTVTFFTASEGDIVMTGEATRVCGGVTVFDQVTEFHVAIRAQ